MKALYCIPIIILGLMIWGDISLVRWAFSQIPPTEWIGLIKASIIIVVISITSGLIIGITSLTTAIVVAMNQ